MKILFLTQRFPFPPDRGDRIRSYHILRDLTKRHEVFLATLTEEEIDESQWNGIKGLCAGVDVGRIRKMERRFCSIAYLPTLIPLTIPNYHSKELKEKLDRRICEESFDLIFIYCSSMAPYVLGYDRIPKVIDFVDVDSEKWLEYARSVHFPANLIYYREGYLLRRYEKRVAKSCRHAFVASRREKYTFEKFIKGTPITAICNGVVVHENIGVRSPGCRLMFTGVMDYWPNEDAVCHFVNDIFPLILEKVPNAEFFIVGQKPTKKVRKLSRIKGVTVTGWIPDPGKYMETATVFVAPIRVARGIQNKILEAMSYGVPVVAYSAAADGLEGTAGRDFLLGDSAKVFAEQTIRLLQDSKLGDQLAANSIKYIRDKHNWSVNINYIEKIIVDVVENAG